MSLNITTSYVKVWEVNPQTKYIDLKISSSDKRGENERTYSSWRFARAIGEAYEVFKDAQAGDYYVIDSGKISVEKYKTKDGNDAFLTRVLIFKAHKHEFDNSIQTAKPEEKSPVSKPILDEDEASPW